MRALLLMAAVAVAPPAPADGPAPPIAVRHDVDDARYLSLGAAFPAAVRVGEDGGDGTLIAPDWVLTAAHVAAGLTRRTDGALSVFVDGQPEGYAVDQVIVHPAYVPRGPVDLALLHLARPVEGVAPAALYRGRDETGQKIVLVGHGDTKPGTGGEWQRDGRPRGATNLVDAVDDQRIQFDFDPPATATPLEGTAGPGDSGGPAFIDVDGRPCVAGVSSMGMPGANGPGTYGAREFYVRVSSFAAWIDGVLADPPAERFVNLPPERAGPGGAGGSGGARVGGPGEALPEGVAVLEGIGLLVAEREGQVRMVGRIDEHFPAALLDGGIRPPAALLRLDDAPVASVAALTAAYEALAPGTAFTLEFFHQGQTRRFSLTK
ncbi:S1 family peptidase [Rubrivirga marina]|uniref:Peptidase S1 domain-containing protein n=1 Tax=Rubrivirga marina TaxID=1196024 RepID=A0A271J1G5_9BACT|nr:S1 family peptidase [Rubrivirga marina]PAP77098.1 hypothetical protein BSZ37_12010 [Rubrivirga marina]